MECVDGYLQGVAGTRLYFRGALPDVRPRAVVLISHGLGEHSGRYSNLTARLSAASYAVYGLDHRGHGRSEGERCFVDSFDDFVADLETFRTEVRTRHPDGPLILIGHSMGGAIALEYALHHQRTLDGLVLCAPASRLSAPVPWHIRAYARLLSIARPRKEWSRLDAALISRDGEVVAAYNDDPLVFHGALPVRLRSEIWRVAWTFPDRVDELRTPVLLLHGTADALVSIAASDLLADRVTAGGAVDSLCADFTYRTYPGLFHELFNEPERGDVLDDVMVWIDERT